MSAPESSSSKGRPSLLSDTAPDVANSNSRILASLEGRVVAQQPVRRRSKKPLVATVLAVLGFGAFGAWQWQRGSIGEHVGVVQTSAASTSPAAAADNKAMTAAGASATNAGVTAAAVAGSGSNSSPSPSPNGAAARPVAQGEAASAPQPAVIVADDSVSGNPTAASSPGAADAGRLSRALASGAAAGQGIAQAAPQSSSATTGSAAAAAAPAVAPAAHVTASAAPASAAPVTKRTQAKAVASRTQHESSKARRTEKLAAGHAAKRVKGRSSASTDDPDADLLAALIARTKPYDAKAPHGASDASGKTASSAKGRASVGDQVKACDKGNFFEAQSCRWHVCSDHWGKDPACPAAAPAAQAN